MFHIRSHPRWSEMSLRGRIEMTASPGGHRAPINMDLGGRKRIFHQPLRNMKRAGAEPVVQGIVATCSYLFSTTDACALHASCSRYRCLTSLPRKLPKITAVVTKIRALKGNLGFAGVTKTDAQKVTWAQIKTFGFQSTSNK